MAGPESTNTALHENRARRWDRWVTSFIVLFLMVPFPFVRFEAWPNGTVVSQRIVMPWSHFRICYVDFHDGEIVEERYGFTWKGELTPRNASLPLLATVPLTEAPLFKWQSNPEIVLREIFSEGDFLQVKTYWRPLLFWPFSLGLGLNSGR